MSDPQNLGQSSPGALSTGAPPSLSPPLSPAPATPSTAQSVPPPPTTSDGALTQPTTTTSNSGPTPGVMGAAASGAPPQPVGLSTSSCCGSSGGSGGTVSTTQKFTRVIAQPADGSSFVVALPTPLANGNYAIVATLGNATVFVTIACPVASRTGANFVCETSGALSTGDTIDFEVTPL